ncbi:MAG: GBS Bsp-like repeat-containing protein [Patescibacteria group bacterium]
MKKLIFLGLIITFLGSLIIPSEVGAQAAWCSYAAPSGDTVYGVSGTRRAYAHGVTGSLGHLYFPTWSESGGQDDIVWYPGVNQGGGTWYADINLASHPETGNIFVHVYVYDASNVPTFCGYSNFYRATYSSGPGVVHTISDSCIESAEAELTSALPGTMIIGQTYNFTVRIRNTGTTWWYHGGWGWDSTAFYKFIQKSGGQSLSLYSDDLGSYANPPTAPSGYGGGSWGYRTITLTAPSTPGNYSLTMQMHHGPFPDYTYQLWDGTQCGNIGGGNSGYEWFGNELTQNFTVTYPPCVGESSQSCTSAANSCGTTANGTQTRTCNAGSWSGWSSCSASTPSNPAGYGNSCTSPANVCGQTQANGTLQCNGSCSSTAPAVTIPGGNTYGAACTSPANACGQTQANGTWQCNGTCSSTAPANPTGYGNACTGATSSPNACGMTNPGSAGTQQCNGTCSGAAGVTPSNALCPLSTVDATATPTSVQSPTSFRITMTSTNASSCTWSRSGSYSGNWTNAPLGATSYDSGNLSWGQGNATYTFTCVNAAGTAASDTASITVDYPACSGASSQSCTSAANACGSTSTGTQTRTCSQGSWSGWSSCSATTPANNTCTPSVDSVTISSSNIVADNSTAYTVSVTGSNPGGASNLYYLLGLINYQGGNGGNYKGYLMWNTGASSLWSAKPGSTASCGGGVGIVYGLGYGTEYINLNSCTVSDSGNSRTVNFNVRFDPAFTSPGSANDISGAVQNTGNLGDGWDNFDINFGLVHNVSTSAGTGCSISPSSRSVNNGSATTFTVTPSTGYGTPSVSGCSGSLSGTTYTTGAITGACTVSATCALNSYTITASAGSGGTVSPAGATSKTYGSSQAYTISPSAGYYISDVLVNGSSVGAVSAYTFNNITSSQTISATFASAYPSHVSTTISSTNVNPNGSTQYNVVVTGTNPTGIGGGASITHEYALINYQGGNIGNYRGYLTWYYDTNYTGWDSQKNKMTCLNSSNLPEGVAAIQYGYGHEYINLVSCRTSVSGITRTTTFTIIANTNFTTPTTGNDISGYVHNTQGLYQGWVNNDTNFNMSLDGGWSAWSPASCPTACGLPASSQTRTCTNPTPAYGGATCSGASSQACAATATCNTAPNVPTISGSTSGYPDTSYTYTFSATDAQSDTVRYGVDWNMDGTADEWLPAGVSYVSSGTSRNTTYSWTTTGAKTFRALTQDAPGLNSAWTNYSVTISAAPVNGFCGTANRTYPVGSSSYGSDTYCSAGSQSASPAFPAPGASATWVCNGLNGGAPSGTCTASNPQAQHNIVIDATPKGSVDIEGGITCQPGTTDCPVIYEEGTVIYLRAYPISSFWKFSGWSGLCTDSSYLCVLEVEQPGTIIPNFIPRLFDYLEF